LAEGVFSSIKINLLYSFFRKITSFIIPKTYRIGKKSERFLPGKKASRMLKHLDTKKEKMLRCTVPLLPETEIKKNSDFPKRKIGVLVVA